MEGKGNRWREGRSEDLLSGARELRRDSTRAEAVLWKHLRDRRLAGHKFRRQHSLGTVVLDFYCAQARLAVEVDGGIHEEPLTREKDELRTSWLRERGIRVLRVTNEEVLHDTDGALRRIIEALTPGGEALTPGGEALTPGGEALTPGPSPASGRGEEESGGTDEG